MPRPLARELDGSLFTEVEIARFESHFVKGADDECWLWTGAINSAGYGSFRWRGGTWNAHRIAYALAHGVVPVDQVVDHACRNHACVNPAHLEGVTHQVNVSRGVARNAGITHCHKGHPFDADNTRLVIGKTGKPERQCRTCTQESNHRTRAARMQDPAYRERQRELWRAESRRPEVRARHSREGKARRANETPEQREKRLEYMRQWRRQHKS